MQGATVLRLGGGRAEPIFRKKSKKIKKFFKKPLKIA
jgi:hypothetical protein